MKSHIPMVKTLRILVVATLAGLNCGFAYPSSLPISGRSQVAQDLDGLDPHEGGISRNLRGSSTVKHYISGPFKGGRAVIEVAKDLFYAEIKIYDKDDVLQRIYSIQTRRDSNGSDEEVIKNPSRVIEQVRTGTAHVGGGGGAGAETETVPASTPPESGRQGAARSASNQAPALALNNDSLKETQAETADVPEASTEAPQKAVPQATEPAQPKPRVHHRKRRLRKSALDTPLSGKPRYVEVEEDEPEAPAVPAAVAGTARKAIEVASVPMHPAAPAAAVSAAVPSAEIPSSAVPAAAPARRARAASSIPLGESEPDMYQAMAKMKKMDAATASARIESDNWTPPPNTAPAPAEDAASAPVPGAARSAQYNNNDLVASRGRTHQAGDAETWSPEETTAKLSPKEEQTQAMLSKLGMAPKPAVKRRVNRDINNPEEGVSPYLFLEKFSGPNYGRHREFERRLFAKSNRKSPVQGYDFYVDEVDRKTERHYLYYYRVNPKDKQNPTLIAVEKHEHVTFMSNYDINQDGAGHVVRF